MTAALPEHTLPLALEALFRAHGAYVHRAARHLGAPSGEIEDVVQEVFLIAHRRLDEFEGRASPRTWLYGICMRVVANVRRRAHRHREKLVERLPENAGERDLEHASDVARARVALDSALDTLDDDKRAVFVLVDIEELSVDEVAKIVEIPKKTVYSRLYVARDQVLAHMRRALGASREGPL